MAATSAQKPIAVALRGHDPETVALRAVGASERLTTKRVCPPDQTAHGSFQVSQEQLNR